MTFTKINTSFLIAFLSLACSCNNNEKGDSENRLKHTNSKHQHHFVDRKKNAYVEALNSGKIQIDTMKSSPLRMVKKTIGKTTITISYSSPGVKGRVIWGGLVPYGNVWVSGAHEATKVRLSNDIKIEGLILPAGKYAIFTIPGEKKWTVILNKNYRQHLTDEYDPKDDVARFDVVPVKIERDMPRLTYQITQTSSKGGTISLKWEKIQITLPFVLSDI